eukprot:Clim_evm17s15 gene=Clim_evmTU17s15
MRGGPFWTADLTDPEWQLYFGEEATSVRHKSLRSAVFPVAIWERQISSVSWCVWKSIQGPKVIDAIRCGGKSTVWHPTSNSDILALCQNVLKGDSFARSMAMAADGSEGPSPSASTATSTLPSFDLTTAHIPECGARVVAVLFRPHHSSTEDCYAVVCTVAVDRDGYLSVDDQNTSARDITGPSDNNAARRRLIHSILLQTLQHSLSAVANRLWRLMANVGIISAPLSESDPGGTGVNRSEGGSIGASPPLYTQCCLKFRYWSLRILLDQHSVRHAIAHSHELQSRVTTSQSVLASVEVLEKDKNSAASDTCIGLSQTFLSPEWLLKGELDGLECETCPPNRDGEQTCLKVSSLSKDGKGWPSVQALDSEDESVPGGEGRGMGKDGAASTVPPTFVEQDSTSSSPGAGIDQHHDQSESPQSEKVSGSARDLRNMSPRTTLRSRSDSPTKRIRSYTGSRGSKPAQINPSLRNHRAASQLKSTKSSKLGSLFPQPYLSDVGVVMRALNGMLTTSGQCVVIGTRLDEVHRMVRTLAVFLTPAERLLCRLDQTGAPELYSPTLLVQGVVLDADLLASTETVDALVTHKGRARAFSASDLCSGAGDPSQVEQQPKEWSAVMDHNLQRLLRAMPLMRSIMPTTVVVIDNGQVHRTLLGNDFCRVRMQVIAWEVQHMPTPRYEGMLLSRQLHDLVDSRSSGPDNLSHSSDRIAGKETQLRESQRHVPPLRVSHDILRLTTNAPALATQRMMAALCLASYYLRRRRHTLMSSASASAPEENALVRPDSVIEPILKSFVKRWDRGAVAVMAMLAQPERSSSSMEPQLALEQARPSSASASARVQPNTTAGNSSDHVADGTQSATAAGSEQPMPSTAAGRFQAALSGVLRSPRSSPVRKTKGPAAAAQCMPPPLYLTAPPLTSINRSSVLQLQTTLTASEADVLCFLGTAERLSPSSASKLSALFSG